MALADKGHLRVLKYTTGLETELSSNSLGACRFARSSAGVTLTQLLVSGALWGINTELFEGETAESYIGEPHREGIDMIPWEAVAAACSETLEEYYSFLKYHLELHGPLAVKMGVINVEGQY